MIFLSSYVFPAKGSSFVALSAKLLFSLLRLSSNEGVASLGLERGQVAVLRPHVSSSYHVRSAAYSCERGERITQMHYFLVVQNFLVVQKDDLC
jgi:hypothetical protein